MTDAGSRKQREWQSISHHKRPIAVVFDMDGLLLDSERLARDTFLAACRDFHFEPDLDIYRQCIGSTYGATREILQRDFGPEFPFEKVHARWSELYDAHVHHLPVDHKAGALDLLTTLSGAGVPLALATSTHRQNAIIKLRLARLDHFFTQLVCGGETPRGKPHPDPYLRACELLGALPADCWAFEDSMNGTRSALAAGLAVFQVPDLIEPDGTDRQLGQVIMPSLHDALRHWEMVHR